ncbi:hypothetical protein PUNSTDRAFT_134931 [Punctularia strigosozonata HHB-11173 SS5]|uniref:uncharacterized protein n=1 Tax=Punctularia strigosozonata (strain HHB-11173) TaxID=741275 RepID=UPI0004417BE7|nr:uncharacterized protein PUNSTDRAFT_134931 [Punctularia strigosozonata HHB-11173 SS5]EIN08553.1 hypothetical protein PUNSTDRAFT_134931 [Punctularia strigosozonata HHB-11173 SS5]
MSQTLPDSRGPITDEDLHELLPVFPEERAKRLMALLNEQQRIFKASFALRVEHNASLPVNRLPPELLSIVFMLWQGTRSSVWSPTITQVCRFWRAVAFRTPLLWNKLDLGRSKLALELSRRFPNIPLRLRMWSTLKWAEKQSVVELVGSCPSRIIEFEASGSHAHGAVIALFQTYAPAMRTLKLFSFDEAMRRHMLKLRTPDLRMLHLYDAPMSLWQSPILRSAKLRELILDFEKDKPPLHNFPSLDNVLDILESLPLLRLLHLSGFLPRTTRLPDPIAEPERLVSLPELFSVWLSDTTLACISVLRRLLIPRCRVLTIICDVGCFQYLPQLWQLVRPQLTSSELHVMASGCKTDVNLRDCEDNSPRSVTLDLAASSIIENRDMLLFITEHLPAANVTCLELSGCPSTDVDVISKAMIQRWTEIRTLRIYDEDFAASFFSVISDDTILARHGPILPHLTSLVLGEVTNTAEAPWFGLCRAEVARRQAGMSQNAARIQSISFIDCHGIVEGEVASLRKIVPMVTIEGGCRSYMCTCVETGESEDEDF